MKNILLYTILLALTSCFHKKQIADSNPSGKDYQSNVDLEKRQRFIEGLSMEIAGNPSGAIESYMACLKADPKDAAVMYSIASVYRKAGDIRSALAFAEKAVENDNKNGWYYVMFAELNYEYGNYDVAAKYYEQATRFFPENEMLFFAHAECLVRTGKLSQSLEVYNEAEKIVGPMPELFKQKYLLYQQLGKTNEALAELDKMVALDPNNPEMLLQKAQALEQGGRLKEAFEAYNKVLELNPGNGYAHLGRARYFETEQQESKVTAEMISAFKSPELPVDSKIQILLDYYDQTTKDSRFLQEAYELLDVLIETHSDDPKPYSIYGDFLSRDRREKEARDMFLKSVRLAPDNFILWQQVIVLDATIAEFDSLYKHSNEALTLFPNIASFYYFTGMAAVQLKKYNDAITTLNSGKQYLFLPEDAALETDMLQLLGDAYYGQGEKENAFSIYDQVLQRTPENTYVLNNYAYYLSLSGTQLEKAAEMARKAIKISPEAPSYLDTYGWILFQQENYEDAVYWIKKAIDNGGNSAVIIEHYGDALYKTGDTTGAVEQWKKAAGIGKGSKMLKQKVETGVWVKE